MTTARLRSARHLAAPLLALSLLLPAAAPAAAADPVVLRVGTVQDLDPSTPTRHSWSSATTPSS